jgi:hypothetical protein
MKTTTQRQNRLMPGGVPRYVRVYDNGGETWDRFTAVFARKSITAEHPHYFVYGRMSSMPFHPQGFGQHGESKFSPVDAMNGQWPPAIGRKCHLGKRIRFQDLPEDCRKLVLRDYKEIWGLE